MSDAVSRHFMSVLSHIERAAGEAGTTVTIHDASKPAHVRLSRGVLVSQARRAQAGHGSGRGNYAVVNADGGPAAANMVGFIYYGPCYQPFAFSRPTTTVVTTVLARFLKPLSG